jgi:hypothetical protein
VSQTEVAATGEINVSGYIHVKDGWLSSDMRAACIISAMSEPLKNW